MLHVSFQIVEVEKRYPLSISRGTQSSSENLFVRVGLEGLEGIGEMSPATGASWTTDRGRRQLLDFVNGNPDLLGPDFSPFRVYWAMCEANVDPAAMAALDVALWDLRAKQLNSPLYKVLGLPRAAVPTSLTIGLNPPDVTRKRVPEILRRTGAKCLKIKLGSPAGLDFDREHFMAALESSKPFSPAIRVDANGGWSLDDAIAMIDWLSYQGAEYVEQPLPAGSESELPHLFKHRKLPIFLDETIRVSRDVPPVFDRCDGVNLKLMKCGGITEALRIVATARAGGLKTMIGCMSETSVAIAAGVALSALFDYIDLDSHLNLNPDPASGPEIIDGVILPSFRPGHGAALNA